MFSGIAFYSLFIYPFMNSYLQTQAKIEVNRVRPKWVKWEREYEDDEVMLITISTAISYFLIIKFICFVLMVVM